MSDSKTNNHEREQESPLFRLHDLMRERGSGPHYRTGGGKNPLFTLADATCYCGFLPGQKDLLTLAYHNRQLEGERVSQNNPEIRYRQSALDDWIRRGKESVPNQQFNRKHQQDPLYLLEEAARYTKRTRNEVSNAFHQGRIPGENIPPFGELAFRQSVLDLWTGKHPAPEEAGVAGEDTQEPTPTQKALASGVEEQEQWAVLSAETEAELISVSEAARRLEMSEAEVRRAYFQKRLAADTASRDLRFTPQAVEDYRAWREQQMRALREAMPQQQQKEEQMIALPRQRPTEKHPMTQHAQEEERPDDLLTNVQAVEYLQRLGYTQVTNAQRIHNAANVGRLPPGIKKPGDKVRVYRPRSAYVAWAKEGALLSHLPGAREEKDTPKRTDVTQAEVTPVTTESGNALPDSPTNDLELLPASKSEEQQEERQAQATQEEPPTMSQLPTTIEPNSANQAHAGKSEAPALLDHPLVQGLIGELTRTDIPWTQEQRGEWLELARLILNRIHPAQQKPPTP